MLPQYIQYKLKKKKKKEVVVGELIEEFVLAVQIQSGERNHLAI